MGLDLPFADVPTPDLRQVRVFLVLCEELSFARTAERLSMTTSAVSQSVRSLEAQVGGSLFERTSRRVAVTPLGERLRMLVAPGYRQILLAFQEARETAVGVTGTLRVGMYTRLNAGPDFDRIVDRFRADHPDCAVEVQDTVWDALGWLRQGHVDMLAQRLPCSDADLVVGPVLDRQARAIAVATDHPLAQQASIAYDELAPYAVTYAPDMAPEMLERFVPPVTPSGHRLRRRTIASLAEATALIAGGEIVHPTIVEFSVPGSVTIPIDDLPPSETALVWRAGAETAAIRAFARTAALIVR